ncbi:MAG: response regulator transcription factor [Lachnospiraceae bacterium]|nr:response regulator transcription factor [Lachnospiraceae bacterium]
MSRPIISIAICDDFESDRKYIKRLCENYFSSQNFDARFFEFSSGSVFLSDERRFDILFLDIELGDMNGLDIMKQLQERTNVWKIIFTTAHKEYVFDAYGSHTLAYLTKPIIKVKLERYLSLALKELILMVSPLVPVSGQPPISLSDIIYIESSGSYYNLHTSNVKNITCSGSVTKFIDSLNTNVIVCISKGTYVNLFHVRGKDSHALTLSDGTVVSIGRAFVKSFTATHMSFLKNHRR